jgi:erythromycin esterase-like protein
MNGSVVKGDIKTIAKNFNIGSDKEIVNLLEWMREYNIVKQQKSKLILRNGYSNRRKINQEIRKYVLRINYNR